MATDIFSQVTDIETLTIKATGLADLAMWIEQARTLIDRIRNLAEHDKQFEARLTEYGIRYMCPEWDDDTSTGMTFLMLHQRKCIGEVAEIASTLGE